MKTFDLRVALLACLALALAGPLWGQTDAPDAVIGENTDNDAFSSRIWLNGTSGRVAGSNAGASKESGEPYHAGNRGGASAWWTWTAPATGTVTFDTLDSNFDTLLAVYTGSSVSSLTEVDSNDDIDDGVEFYTQSEVNFRATGGQTYHIVVDGYAGASGNIVLDWQGPVGNNDAFSSRIQLNGTSGWVARSNAGAGKESGEPYHAGDQGGASVWWTWTAPATGTVTFDTLDSNFDTLLAVYTGRQVNSLTEVDSNDDIDDGVEFYAQSEVSFWAIGGRTYHIVVDGYAGASGNIVLDWRGPVGNNDAFSSRIWLNGTSGWVVESNAEAGKESGEPYHAGNRGGASVWWTWTAPATGTVTFDTLDSNFDTLLAVYTGSRVGSLTEVDSNDDIESYAQSEVSFRATGGRTYHIVVDGYAGASGNIVLDWQGPVGNNDAFSSLIRLNGASGRVARSNAGAGKESGEPYHAGNRGGASVWWTWTAPATGTVTFDTLDSNFDTLLAVYTGSRVGSLTEVDSNDDIDDGVEFYTQSEVSFRAIGGRTYHIVVDGYAGASGNIMLDWQGPGGQSAR